MATTIDASTAGVGGLITTPDNSGNLNIQSGGSTKIAVTSAGVAVTGLSKGSLPTGSVLQVVTFNSDAARGTTTSTSFVASTLAATITPTSATSKIYIVTTFPAFTTSTNVANYTIYRDATNIGGTGGFVANVTNNTYASVAMSYLDSPATTSATTYTVYYKTNNNTVGISDNSFRSTMTLMEIAA
jgi:hypothetical protein